MANRPLPPVEILRQLLRYEPETGKLFWRRRPASMFARQRFCDAWNTRFAGREAATLCKADGHLSVVINYKRYLVHRVIWKMAYGDEPHRIDHRDLDGANNRLSNLRRSTVSQNGMNRKAPSTNTSGIKGVHFRKDTGRWSAMLVVDGKAHRFGCFGTKDEAAEAYRKGAIKHQGEFANFST